MKKAIIFSIIVIPIIIGAVLLLAPKAEGIPITVYKSASCGCCVQYSSYLEDNNYNVKMITTENMQSIKTKYDIPKNMESCHTSIIDNYFVEGHIPLEAINKLLIEKPLIDGIALPNMPSGSPGMPGIKRETFVIYSITNGQIGEFMRI